MISNAFKSAYINQVGQQTQGINTITSGVKDVGTIVLAAMGFAGGFGESTMGKLASAASQHALAGRIGGIGGNLMLATLEEKKADAELNSILARATSEDIGKAFDDIAGGAKSKEEFDRLSTVWDKISKMREKAAQNQMLKEVGSKLKEGEKENDNDR